MVVPTEKNSVVQSHKHLVGSPGPESRRLERYSRQLSETMLRLFTIFLLASLAMSGTDVTRYARDV